MKTNARIAAALLCVAGLVALIALGRGGHPPSDTADEVAASFSNQDCRRCHAGVWSEWQASYHARAFSDDRVQAAFQHFGFDRQCQSCHAPERHLVLDLDTPVVLREDEPETGVDCLSCHGLTAGGVAAVRDLPDAPCRPIETAGLSSSLACGVCHDAIYKDWQASRYRTEGKHCQTCHMQPTDERRGGRSHLCLGGHDDALVRSGARLACRQEGDEVLVSVTNHATGHNFPGERHNRLLLVEVIEESVEGEITLARQSLIKGITPFRGESSAERLQVDQTFEERYPIIAPAATAKVRLLYKPFPWYSDSDALLVAEATIEINEPQMKHR
jgi:hypothetical protein